MFNISLP